MTSSFETTDESWTCNHFSQFRPDGNLPALLRTIASSIEDLGDVILLDVVINQEDNGGWNCTVYFGENDEEETSV